MKLKILLIEDYFYIFWTNNFKFSIRKYNFFHIIVFLDSTVITDSQYIYKKLFSSQVIKVLHFLQHALTLPNI